MVENGWKLHLDDDLDFVSKSDELLVLLLGDNLGDAMLWLAGAGKLVGLVRETHHYGWNLAELQRTKHLLAACAGRRAIVCFPEDEHHRRLHIVDVTDR